ncbi:hypothetical protein [Hathewaya massiliensis]|uniref:hypothetical protein n=1 Tax=Hathewaya massiliensis TaxID=1964382 RepID=UPI00115B25B0|nr:hypothetical protein [Hathewaya massiliensis]
MNKLDLSALVNKYSKNDKSYFSGLLMYKDKEVAIIEDSKLTKIIDKSLLPIIMLNENIGSFDAWLQTRVIDTHRANSRHVRRRLSVRSEVPNEIVVKSRALSITDSYWLKWTNENLTYNHIRSKLSDGLNTIALYGNSENVTFNDTDLTPELTNIGSFEKCWKLIDGSWFMIKKGTYKENFAEVLISKIAIHLGFNAISYEPLDHGRLVKSKDFTNNAEVDFEPMFSFVRDYWDIDNSIEIINQLGFINEFLDITYITSV